MNLFSKGTVLAGAAWALFACGGGSSSAPETTPAATGEPTQAAGDQTGAAPEANAGDPATTEQVKCSGINECKGHASCGGADHSCKGQNECKGKGWVMASAEDCNAKGGSVVQ